MKIRIQVKEITPTFGCVFVDGTLIASLKEEGDQVTLDHSDLAPIPIEDIHIKATNKLLKCRTIKKERTSHETNIY